MKQVLLLQLEVRKLCHQFLGLFPLSLFLLLVSEHFPYFLLVLLVLLASVPVLLVFLHLDSLAVPVSDLGSLAVPAFDLGSPAVLAFDPDSPAVPVSDPALVILHYIPNVPLPGD